MGPFESVYAPLANSRDLRDSEAAALMHWLIGGDASESEILMVLNSLCDKGVLRNELVSFARVMRNKALTLEHRFDDLVDTCGTGGGKPTFNLSTAAAFVAAGAGARIAKHGNRSTTGLGSADVLEFLGLKLDLTPHELEDQLISPGITFLFAPAHHPAMRHVAAARKLLGRRSIFNLLGPLSNPAGASRQLMGIYDPAFLHLMADSLMDLGAKRAVLVHSEDGLDEISPCAPTKAIIVWDGEVREATFNPEDFGIPPLMFSEIAPGANLAESANFLEEAIAKIDSVHAKAVIPGAAVAIWIAGLEDNLKMASERAKASIRDGLAAAKLSQLVLSPRLT